MFVINFILVIVSVLVAVLYFTMFERKLMSYIQLRKGPNKVGFLGLFTPLADALKLLFKSMGLVLNSNELFFYISPVFSVIFLFLVWSLFPFLSSNNLFWYGFILFMCISSVNVYCILGSGWGSNSKYCLLGAVRGLAQVVSYEILFVFISFFPLCFQGTYFLFSFIQINYFYGLWLFPLFFLWVVSCIAETNRSPFDFSEGESELVSGFNTEYGAMEFACLFLGEYGQIIFISCLGIVLYYPFNYVLVNLFLGLILAISFIWFRSTFPRFRYDLLMELAWCFGLIFVLVFFFYLFGDVI
uniref:NADH-ubiquinone oxidoreductase chain 1 n=1 Tax=Parakontikia atrata TaxID=2903269 RepID=A0A9E7V7Z7_9PLAT|nr:NADH dehydrogenase subunit 1 [Parakontikia atrata]UZA66414.1 NADH dehydrogenase subunit 1 [Parakontikia atrata]